MTTDWSSSLTAVTRASWVRSFILSHLVSFLSPELGFVLEPNITLNHLNALKDSLHALAQTGSLDCHFGLGSPSNLIVAELFGKVVELLV